MFNKNLKQEIQGNMSCLSRFMLIESCKTKVSNAADIQNSSQIHK